jgi:hypothetical protein
MDLVSRAGRRTQAPSSSGCALDVDSYVETEPERDRYLVLDSVSAKP